MNAVLSWRVSVTRPDCLANSACRFCLENLHTFHYGRNYKDFVQKILCFCSAESNTFKAFLLKNKKKNPLTFEQKCTILHSLVSSLSNQKYVQLCLKHLSHQICFSLPYQPKFAQLLPRPKNAFLQWTSQICTMAGITKFCQYVKILIGSKSMTETTKLLISVFFTIL